MCKPALDQMLRTRRGKLDGASRRGPRGELGDSPPLCGEGLTCTEVSLKEYECEEENTTGKRAYWQDKYEHMNNILTG